MYIDLCVSVMDSWTYIIMTTFLHLKPSKQLEPEAALRSTIADESCIDFQ